MADQIYSSNDCLEASCTADCIDVCADLCGSSCTGACTSSCYLSCTGECDGCTGGCDGKCLDSCTGGCVDACTDNCGDVCSSDCDDTCSGSSTGSTTTYTKILDLYANDGTSTKVRYHSYSGTVSGTITVSLNTDLSSSVMTRSGYKFKGYASSSSATTAYYVYDETATEFSPDEVSIADNTTVNLYAVWEELGSYTYYIEHAGEVWPENGVQGPVNSFTITNQYGSGTSKTISSAGTETLSTHGKFATSKIIIGDKTLNCDGKFIQGNIFVTTEHYYTLTGTSTNCYIGGNTKYTSHTSENKTTVLYLTADGEDYILPTSVTFGSTTVTAGTTTVVSGQCTVLYTRTSDTSGSLHLSAATGNISFTVTGTRLAPYLCFTSNAIGTIMYLYCTLVTATGIPSRTLYYSTDRTNWTELVAHTTDQTGTYVYLSNVGDKVYIKGDNEDGLSYYEYSSSAEKYYYEFYQFGFGTGSEVECSGSVMSLLDNGEESITDIPCTYCFSDLFSGCTAMTTPPVLPATSLASYCYRNMFYGCTSLITAPSLPATSTLACCYYAMFYGCTSLTTVPKLPATTLTSYCYGEMFRGCSSLYAYSSSGTGYTNTWRLPTSGTWSRGSYDTYYMLYGTTGSYASSELPGGTSSTSLTLYTQNAPV